MPEEKTGNPSFKVVDRRPFSADGTRRENVAAEDEKKTGPPPPSRAPAGPPVETAPEEYFGEPPAGIDTLISYLSTTAMFQLGMVPSPTGERIPADLPNAQRTIDLLEVLQEKTRGNLTPDEERLLEDVLYELRLNFVEVEKHRARQGK